MIEWRSSASDTSDISDVSHEGRKEPASAQLVRSRGHLTCVTYVTSVTSVTSVSTDATQVHQETICTAGAE